MASVLIVDDHPLLAIGLVSALQVAGHIAEHAAPVDDASVIAAVSSLSPDLVVLDFELPGIGVTADLVRHLCGGSASPGIDVVMLSGSADRRGLAECLEAGAQFIVAKTEPIEAIVGAIGLAASNAVIRRGDTAARLDQLASARRADAERLAAFEALTPREVATLAALCAGTSPQEIAASTFVAISTVRTHIKSVLRKLDATSQLEAVSLAHRSGWIALQSDVAFTVG